MKIECFYGKEKEMSEALTEAWNAAENVRKLLDIEEGYKLILATYRILILKQVITYKDSYVKQYKDFVEVYGKEESHNERIGSQWDWIEQVSELVDVSIEHLEFLLEREKKTYIKVIEDMEELPEELPEQLIPIIAELLTKNKLLFYYIWQEISALENIDRILNKQKPIGVEEEIDFDKMIMDGEVERTMQSYMIIKQVESEFNEIYALLDEFQEHIELCMAEESEEGGDETK